MTLPTTSSVNIAVIGIGRIGKIHARNLTYRIPGARLVALADLQLQSAQELAGQLAITAVHDDYHAILNDPTVDAIVICSPTNTHAEIMIEAAAAGKHIFCEKPIDLSLERIDQALAAVKASGVKLQIGFNRRFDPSFRQVQQAVQQGKIGQPHILRITSRDPAPPPLSYIQVSGGIFMDMAIHDFDMARFLIGSEVTEVFAKGAALVDPQIGAAGDLDTAVTTLQFANGAIGTIDNSRKAVYGYDQRLEVFGSAGAVSAGNHVQHQAIFSDAAGIHTANPLDFFMERYAESYSLEMQEFVTCLHENKLPNVSGEDARIAAVIALAAKRSSFENRPVRLSEIG